MSDERPDPDSERTDADDEELSQRDLGLGHPLSPEDSADPEPADSESGSAAKGPDRRARGSNRTQRSGCPQTVRSRG
jgi:hypothetical protein